MEEKEVIELEEKTEVNNTVKCLNCGTEFQGKFCPECGQRADTGRFTVKFIFSNFILGILSNDGGVWFTIKNLFTKPGQMMIDIINGKRKSYFSPFPMLFLTLSMYVVIFSFTGSKKGDFDFTDLDKEEQSSVEIKPDNDASAEATMIKNKVVAYIVKFSYLYKNHYTALMVMTIPVYLLSARVCYGRKNRKRYNWGEYSIPVIYATIMTFLYRCVASICYAFSPKIYDVMDNWAGLVVIVAFTVCFKKMLEFSTVKTVWRTILMDVFYFSVIIGLIVVAGVLFVWINYNALRGAVS
jgi:RNA polymerase subunit RPABC4/transcription elongation factor Spt4